MTGPSPAGASPAAGNDSLPVPPPAEISEEEIDKHARSRVLIKLLRLREQYRKVFKDDYEYVLQQAAEAVREFAASNREAYTTGRNAILEIGGYQAWDGVLRHPYYSDELYDRTSIFAIICIVAGSIGFAIDYSVTGHGIWWVILLALIVIGASFALCLVAYLVMQRTDYLPKRWRKLCNFAALLILTVVLWPLWHWTGFWGYALFAGGAVATGILIAVGIAIQMSELIVAIMFRRSWMRHTTGEIIETLAAVRAALSKPPLPNAGDPIWAAGQLDHAASCIERYLPSHLAGARQYLLGSVQQRCAEMATAVRDLAADCLLARTDTRDSIRGKVSVLMVAAIRGLWGEWDCKPADPDENTNYKRRISIGGLLKFAVFLLPVITVIGVGIYLWRTNPSSKLLDPQIIGPVAVAAFGWLTALLTELIDPKRDQSAAADEPTKPAPLSGRSSIRRRRR